MKPSSGRFLAVAMTAAAIFAAPALAQDVKMEGIIVTHQHGMLTIKTPSGNQPVALGPNVRVRSISGAFSGNKQVVPPASLIPGLPVIVEGVHGPGGHFVAHEVDYKAKDYKVAAQVNAGVEETARREAELRNAYSKMGEWNVLQEKNVFFKTGSAVISAEGKQMLTETAREAPKHKGYAISVLGYADPRGTAKANERLSNRRAQAVINFLKQSGHVQPGRVLAASAMGEEYYHAAQAADEKAHANSRRVTVRVVQSAAHLNP
jgi:outer membrane protein OmpA-like peptidoglycan-associated protein